MRLLLVLLILCPCLYSCEHFSYSYQIPPPEGVHFKWDRNTCPWNAPEAENFQDKFGPLDVFEGYYVVKKSWADGKTGCMVYGEREQEILPDRPLYLRISLGYSCSDGGCIIAYRGRTSQ